MTNLKLSKVLFAGLLLTAGAAQAAAPKSVSEAPGAWYADQIVTSDLARGAAQPVFPTAAYEHGFTGRSYVQESRTQPGIAGSTSSFPTSVNETSFL